MEISRINSSETRIHDSLASSQQATDSGNQSQSSDVPSMADSSSDTNLMARSIVDECSKDIVAGLKKGITDNDDEGILSILNSRDTFGIDIIRDCFFYGFDKRRLEIIRKCVELNPNLLIDINDKNLIQAFHNACEQGCLEIVKYILELKPEIVTVWNEKVNTGAHSMIVIVTKAFCESRKSTRDYQQYLLFVKSFFELVKDQLDVSCERKLTALSCACAYGLKEIIEIIYEIKPNLLIDINDKNLIQAFHNACARSCNLDIVKYMINLQPEIVAAQYAEISDGKTGLMLSIIKKMAIAEYLLDHTIQNCPDTLGKMDNNGEDAELHLMTSPKKALYAKMLKFKYTLVLSLRKIEVQLEKTKNALTKKFVNDKMIREYIYDKNNEPFIRFFLTDILFYSLCLDSRLDITRYCLQEKPSLVYWIFTDDYATGNPQKYTAVQFARTNKNQAAVKLIENTKDRLIEEAKRRMPKISSINEDKPVEKLSKSQKRKAKRKKAVERVTTVSSSSTQLICTDPEAEKKMMEKSPITILEKLKDAILNGDDECILSILKDRDSQLDQERIAQCLMYAMGNNTDIVKQCIALDSSCVQFRDSQGLSIYSKVLSSLKNFKDNYGISSKLYKNYLQSIKLLLALKDQLDFRDSFKNTPLSAACCVGLIDVVKEICVIRSDLLTDINNITLIDSFIGACQWNQLEVVKYMVGLQPNIILAQDESIMDGMTGLMMAIHKNKSDIYNYLIDYSIENNLRALMLVDNEGRNVREIAISKRNQALVRKIDQALAPEKIKTKIINEVPRWIAEALELEREQQKQYEEQRQLQIKEVQQSRQRSLGSDYSESESSEPKYSEAYLWYLANNGSNIVVNVKKSKRKKHTIEVVQETQRMVEKEQMSPEKVKWSDSVSTLIIPKECEDVYSILTGSFKDGALYFVDALHFIDRLLRANASLGLRWERNFKRGGSHNTIRILDANGNQACHPFTLVANDKHLCSKAVKAMAESIDQLGKLCQDSDSSSATSTQSSSSDDSDFEDA